MKITPILTNGDMTCKKPNSIKEYWYVFHRVFRVLKKNSNQYDIDTPMAARAIWAPDTIEGYWYRKLSQQQNPSAMSIYIKMRLALYKSAGFDPLIKELRRKNSH